VHVISSAHSLRVGGRRPTPATPVTLTSTDYFKESNTNITIPLWLADILSSYWQYAILQCNETFNYVSVRWRRVSALHGGRATANPHTRPPVWGPCPGRILPAYFSAVVNAIAFYDRCRVECRADVISVERNFHLTIAAGGGTATTPPPP